MSSLVEAEVLATCSALGFVDGDKYEKEPDCLEAIKDLIRYLKRDDDTHEIRRLLGSTQVLVTDLIPMLKSHWSNKEILDVLLRLLVNLMNPALLLFNEELPTEKTTRNYYLEIVATLQRSKQAFADEKVFAVLTSKLGELLKLDWEHRHEEDRLTIERILILVRNVLNVPANEDEEKRTDNDASVHDQVLWALHQSGMEDLLLYIASSDDESNLCMHVVEIISLMFREQDPSLLATAGISRSQTEKQKDENELLEVKRREMAQTNMRRAKFFATRHSRFGGTFCLRDVKSVSEREVIYHRPLVDIDTLSFDRNKVPTRKPRHRRPLVDNDLTRRSTLSIRLFLKEFCIEFLNSAYNPLMNLVKDNLSRQRAQAHDESYYFWAMKFFMEFNRLHHFKVDLVSETMSIQTFHFVQTHIDTCLESMTVDKKMIPVWSRRLHLGLRAYKELLQTVAAMDHSSDPDVCDSARIIKGNVFYNVDYRELTLVLIRQYDELKMSKLCLKDLVETIHVFLKLLEQFIKTSSHLVVQNKKRKARKKKPAPKALVEQTMEERWDTLADKLSAVLQGRSEIPQGITPFDAAAEVSIEEQRADAMYRIQDCLRKNNAGEAVALFRAAREVWPEDNAFGIPDIEPEEEFLSLREVFFTDLPRRNGDVDAQGLAPDRNTTNEEGNQSEDDEEEQAPAHTVAEQEFSFMDFVKKFAGLRVVQAYCKLLKDYDQNSIYLNRCILKMLHRIAWDCKFPGLLYQASVFRTFQKVFADPSVTISPIVKEIARFGKFIVGKFTDVAKTNSKVFVELLLWKTAEDAYELENGYGTYKKNAKAVKQLWSSEQEEELTHLYERFKDQSDATKDVVDLIMEHMIDDTKTRRQILKQLVRQQLVNDVAALKKAPGAKRPPREWQEHEEQEIRELYERFIGSSDVLGEILNNMTLKRPRGRVIEKLLELKIITDRKELHKKRSKGDGKPITKNKKSSSTNGDEVEHSDGNRSHERMVDSEEYSSQESDQDSVPVGDIPQLSAASLDIIPAVISERREGVTWILTSLQQVAYDREVDGDTEPVPLLPLSESALNAMADSQFLQFLPLIGLRPPNSEQESYWRVPSFLTPIRLKRIIAYLEKVLAGDFSDVPPVEQSKHEVVRKRKSSNFEKLKALANVKRAGQTKNQQKRQSAKRKMPLHARIQRKNATDSSSDDDDIPLSKQHSLSDKKIESRPCTSGKRSDHSASILLHNSSDDDSQSDQASFACKQGKCNSPSFPISDSVSSNSNKCKVSQITHSNKRIVEVVDDSSDDEGRLIISEPTEQTSHGHMLTEKNGNKLDTSTDTKGFIINDEANSTNDDGNIGDSRTPPLKGSLKRRIVLEDSDDENNANQEPSAKRHEARSVKVFSDKVELNQQSPKQVNGDAATPESDSESVSMPILKKKLIVVSDSDE